MAWLLLLLAGIFEIGFTTSLKLSANFTNWKWTCAFLICIFLSFFFLNKASQDIPLGTAYGVWTGIGAVGTVLVGIYFFNEPAYWQRTFFIVTLIASIVGLKMVS